MRSRIKVTPTVTAGAYSIYDVIGGRLQFIGVRSARLQSVTIADKANQVVDYVLIFFESAPTNITDNNPYTIADADLSKIVYECDFAGLAAQGIVVARSFTDNRYTFIYKLDVPIQTAGGDLYAFLYTTGTPTYASTSDITVTIQIEQAVKE